MGCILLSPGTKRENLSFIPGNKNQCFTVMPAIGNVMLHNTKKIQLDDLNDPKV
jgi:hypothetical protein